MPIPYPDPDIVNISGNVDPPEVGNILTVPLQYLDKSPVTVEWSQTFRANRDEYYQLVYTNTSKANTKYFLFVSSGKLEDFKKLDTNNGSDGKLTFKVSPDFMYGQRDNTGRNRFLVYHQRDRTIFQTRFIMAAWHKFGTMLSGFVDDFNKDENASKALAILTRYFGDPLRKFWA